MTRLPERKLEGFVTKVENSFSVPTFIASMRLMHEGRKIILSPATENGEPIPNVSFVYAPYPDDRRFILNVLRSDELKTLNHINKAKPIGPFKLEDLVAEIIRSFETKKI